MLSIKIEFAPLAAIFPELALNWYLNYQPNPSAMKKRFFLLATLILLACRVFSQYSGNDLRSLSLGEQLDVSVFNLNRNTTVGTPLFNESWRPGYLLLADKDTFGMKVDVNIDIAKQKLYFKLDNGHTNVLSSKFIKAVRIDTSANMSLLFKVISKDAVEGGNDKELTFYQVLHESPSYVLLKSHAKIFRKADLETPYGASRTYDEYTDKTGYWLKGPGGSFEKLRLQAKAIEKILGGDEDKIKEIKKWKQLDLSTETGAAELLRLLENAR